MVAVEDLAAPRPGRACRRSSIAHGSSLTIWSHVRMTPYSGEALGIASRRLSSRVGLLHHVLGQLGGLELRAERFDLAAAAPASPSPSSLRIAFICSCR